MEKKRVQIIVNKEIFNSKKPKNSFQIAQKDFEDIITHTFDEKGNFLCKEAEEDIDKRRYYVSLHIMTMVTGEEYAKENVIKRSQLVNLSTITIRKYEKSDKMNMEDFSWGDFTTEYEIQFMSMVDNRTLDVNFKDLNVLIKTKLPKISSSLQGYSVDKYNGERTDEIEKFTIYMTDYLQEKADDYELYEYKTWI